MLSRLLRTARLVAVLAALSVPVCSFLGATGTLAGLLQSSLGSGYMGVGVPAGVVLLVLLLLHAIASRREDPLIPFWSIVVVPALMVLLSTLSLVVGFSIWMLCAGQGLLVLVLLAASGSSASCPHCLRTLKVQNISRRNPAAVTEWNYISYWSTYCLGCDLEGRGECLGDAVKDLEEKQQNRRKTDRVLAEMDAEEFRKRMEELSESAGGADNLARISEVAGDGQFLFFVQRMPRKDFDAFVASVKASKK